MLKKQAQILLMGSALLAASFANRKFYGRAGDLGYTLLIRRVARADAREFLQRLYAPRWWKSLIGRLRLDGR